ncbi:Hypothetical predicted protein [Cloeon dipterum]|uniref:Uncharacterized protein n=1 Tax=Cloeon dipterum TaxID=197152 RepID=A0A8S1DW81_9INSE|nr:Hypothetical predicted protein [Cloeon dipterum]
MYTDNTSAIPLEGLVPCSPNNPTPCYVVGMFDYENHYPRLGYVYYLHDLKSFSAAYFMEGTDKPLISEWNNPYNKYYFLVADNVSFRPHNQVPENLRCRVVATTHNEYINIGTVDSGKEEICGPVINGVCYSYGVKILSENENYKILAFNEG